MARTAGSTAQVTRPRILDAARELFADQGYAGTTLRDIAERVGLTKAALYYHFESKRDILAALFAPRLDALDELAARWEAAARIDREAALREFLELLAAPDPVLTTVLTDPSALRDIADQLHPRRRTLRLERALAGGGDDEAALVAVRCALGAVRSGVMGTRMAARAAGATAPSLSPAHADLIVSAGLAAWSIAPE